MTQPHSRPNGPAPRPRSRTRICEVRWASSTAGAENKLSDLAGTCSSSGQCLGASAAWKLLRSLESSSQPACGLSVSTLSSPHCPLHMSPHLRTLGYHDTSVLIPDSALLLPCPACHLVVMLHPGTTFTGGAKPSFTRCKTGVLCALWHSQAQLQR